MVVYSELTGIIFVNIKPKSTTLSKIKFVISEIYISRKNSTGFIKFIC